MDQYSQTSCPICYSEYTPENVKPIMICSRQHHICAECAEKIKKEAHPLCVVCRQTINKEKLLPFRLMIKNIENKGQIQSHFRQQKQHFVKEIEDRIKSNIALHQGIIFEKDVFPQNILKNMAQFKVVTDLKLQKMTNIVKSLVEKNIKAKRFYEVIIQLKNLIAIDPEIYYNALNKYEFLGLTCLLEKKYLKKSQNYVWDCLLKLKKQQLSVNIFDLLSLCLLECSNNEEEERWYQKMLQLYPMSIPFIYGLALLYHKRGDVHKAKQMYEKVIQLEKTFDKAYQMVAFIQLQSGQHAKAKEYAEQALKNNPLNPYANFIKALTLGDFTQEIEILESLIFSEKKFIRVNFQLGLRMLIIKDYKAALSHFTTCKNSGQTFQKLKLNIAKSLFYLQDFNAALTEISSVKYEKNEDEAQRWFYLALIKQKIPLRQSEIIDCFQRSIKLNSNQSEVYCRFVDYLEKQKRYDKIVTVLKAQIAIFPRQLRIYKKIGIIYSKLSKYSEAIDCFKIYSMELGEDRDLFFHFGVAYFQLNELNAALTNFFKCLQLNIEPIIVRMRISQIYKKKCDYKKQFEFINDLIDKQPANKQNQHLLFQFYNNSVQLMKKGKYFPRS